MIKVEIYAWKHPEKTSREISIDLWSGKVLND